MIASDDFVAAFGSVPAGDDEAMLKVIISAVRLGFAIVMVHPDDKRPLCTLNSAGRNKADREAREAAYAAGDEKYGSRKHACGIAHALTKDMADDPTKLGPKIGTIYRRLVKEYGRVNIGVELGRSRMLVVDVDTKAELEAFERDWRNGAFESNSETDDCTDPGLTVRSPGRKIDGEWVHRDGGHYWFTVPDSVELPHGMTSYRAEGGWVAMWADHQVLVPPSKRPEGPYVLVGAPQPAPQWLIDRLLAAGAARAERQRQKGTGGSGGPVDGSGDIDQWAAGTPWADLLAPDDWIETGLPESCGCPTWTAPGSHASRKSAVAHEPGCSEFDTSPGHAPLHVWTDSPPAFLIEAKRRNDQETFTKLQYIAWRDHGGNTKAALVALGLNSNGAVAPFEFSGDWVTETTTPAAQAPPVANAGDETDDDDDDSKDADSGDTDPPAVPAFEPTQADIDNADRLVRAAREYAGSMLRMEIARRDRFGTPRPTPDEQLTSRYEWAKAFRDDFEKKQRTAIVKEAADADALRRAAGEIPAPWLKPLPDLLSEVDEEAVYRIDRLFPTGGNVLLVAQYKSGKTTLLGNVIRSLVDAEPFLGVVDPDPMEDAPAGFTVAPLEDGERVVLLDLELDERTLRRWLRDQGISNRDAVSVRSLRGRVAEFDIRDAESRTRWADLLREMGCRVLVVDPLMPLLAHYGCDENDNSEVGRVLYALDQLKAEAGISEMFIAHHMGHTAERGRGASVLRGWPDAEWKLTREGKKGEEPPPDAQRYLSALGRDVDVPEFGLTYDPATRRYTAGEGGRKPSPAGVANMPEVLKVITDQPGISTRKLEEILSGHGVGQKTGRAARHELEANREIHAHPGPRDALLWFPGRDCGGCTPVTSDL
jgi:AAA domain-containing protein/bifunctional DNA primase/polymerase-like protein